jgi:hypothetical protein
VTFVPKIDMDRETAKRRLHPKQERIARAQEILESLPQTDRVADLAREILAGLQADLDR